MRYPIALVAVLAVFLGAPCLDAQEREASSGTNLVGQVVDASTGTPLLGAFVHLEGDDRGVLTEKDGTFVLPRVPKGVRSVMAEQLGYADLIQTTIVGEENEPMVLAMAPDPILLEGIEVVMDRFERRRRATAVMSQVFERDDLLTTAAFDAVDFLEGRSFLKTYPCLGTHFESECAMVRGRIAPVRVYVDEMPFFDGLAYLRTLQPYDLHRVEVYAGGRHIRVYTEWFVERAGRTRIQPIAFIL
jgi:hypothetical protein